MKREVAVFGGHEFEGARGTRAINNGFFEHTALVVPMNVV